MRLPRPIDAATQARVSAEGRRCVNPPSLQSPSVMSASLFVRGLRPIGVSNAPEAVTRLLDGRHHLERFAMEQAGEVDYLITWRRHTAYVTRAIAARGGLFGNHGHEATYAIIW